MKILVGFDPNKYPGVECFERLGSCDFVRYDYKFLRDNIHRYEIIIPHLFEKLDQEILESATNIKIVATPSTGRDHIDVEFLKKKGCEFISLNDCPECIREISSTAELAWLLLQSVSRNINSSIKRVVQEKSWVNTDIRGYQLRGKTIGIIGYGRLGKFMAQYASAFGMRVLAYDINEYAYDENCRPVSLEQLLNESDFISLHAKLNAFNHHLIGEREVRQMKKGVYIINTARGELLDSGAVLQGIVGGKVRGVGLDVVSNEYMSMSLPDDPLVRFSLTDDRVLITPHIGGSTYEAHSVVFEALAEVIESR